MALDALYVVVVNGNEPLDGWWKCVSERLMSDRGVGKGVEAVQVLVKNESVDMKVGEDAHEGVGWLEGVDFGPKRLVCRDCLLYTSPSPRDGLLSRMPSSA